MSNPSDLQQIAKMVDLNRQRMEELQTQIQRIDTVLFEHEETKMALESLSNGSKGHIPLGAGVMIPISSNLTTIVDLGSGVFGERAPEGASEIVSERYGDLSNLKQQFQEELTTVASRIEELSTTFDKLSKEIATTTQENAVEEKETKPKPRRRRRMGEELTLDD